MKRDDVLLHTMASGGGWGDPLDRDPELVRADVRSERLTADHVRREYGVVVDPESFEVDLGATERLRDELRARRES